MKSEKNTPRRKTRYYSIYGMALSGVISLPMII